MKPLDRYMKHARLFGCEEVFETAMSELTIKQLGGLSSYLQRIGDKVSVRGNGDSHKIVNREWKLPADIDRVSFALALMAAGEKKKVAYAEAMTSASTVSRALAENPDLGSENPVAEPWKLCKSAHPVGGPAFVDSKKQERLERVTPLASRDDWRKLSYMVERIEQGTPDARMMREEIERILDRIERTTKDQTNDD